MTTHRLQVLPKQLDFLQATEREVMYSGAVGAGKTRVLCYKLAMRASVAGARELLIRKTLTSLKGSTLKTLLEGDGDMPPVLPHGTYTHNRADKMIRIHGGGEIIYLPMVNDGDGGTQQRIGSYNGTGAAIDEVIELDENDYRMVDSRCRVKIDGVPNQVYSATNPATPSHHLAVRFAAPGSGVVDPVKGCRCITAKTSENYFLPADYLESLERSRGTVWYRRMVEGVWCGNEGLVYDQWDRVIHVRTRLMTDFHRFIIGVDQGFTNPFAALLIGVDNDGRSHTCREEYRSKWEPDDKLAALRRLADFAAPYGAIEATIIDPSAPELISMAAKAGLSPRQANNDILPGIHAVAARLQVAGDGLPRHSVDPSCVNDIREFESYQWKPDAPKDVPIPKFNHARDAHRYGTMHLDAGFVPLAASPVAQQPLRFNPVAASAPRGWDDDERGWTTWRQ